MTVDSGSIAAGAPGCAFVLLALSAPSREKLDAAIEILAERLRRADPQALLAIAAELDGQPPHWSHRCALVVDTAEQALALLQSARERKPSGQLFWSEWTSRPVLSAALSRGAEALHAELPHSEFASTDLSRLLALADLHCQGYDPAWNLRAGGGLPVAEPPEPGNEPNSRGKLHPLVHQRVNVAIGFRYRTTFSGEEEFLRDHQVWGQKVLPGVAQLEWARAAMCLAMGDPNGHVELQQVIFLRPLIVESSLSVDIELIPISPGHFTYTIYTPSDDGSENTIYGQGQARAIVLDEVSPQIDLAALPPRTNSVLEGEAVWSEFGRRGLQLGPAFQMIRRLETGNGIAIAHVQALLHLEEASHYRWWPMLTDAAAQSAAARFEDGDLYVPFAVQSIRSWSALPNPLLVVVEERADSSISARKWDVRLVDDSGKVAMLLEGIVTRRYALTRRFELVLASPCWENVVVAAGGQRQLRRSLVLADRPAPPSSDALADDSVTWQVISERSVFAAEAFVEGASNLLNWLKLAIASTQSQVGLMLQLVVPTTGVAEALEGLGGMLRTAQREYPHVQVQVVAVDAECVTVEVLRSAAEIGLPALRHQEGVWQTLRYARLPPCTGPATFKDEGVYWITGGLGGLGKLFAEEITRKVRHPRLILNGRRPPTAKQLVWFDALRAQGAEVVFVAADVSSAEQMAAFAQHIRATFRTVNGLIHAAGVLRDRLLVNKSIDDIASVLAPKVTGLSVLDEVTADMRLDWFVLCSSTSSVWGNSGQADYACANGFMDSFARDRNKRVAEGSRHGQTVAINWPFWAHGGMRADDPVQRRVRRSLGMVEMPTEQGMLGLQQALASGQSQVVVLYGEQDRLTDSLQALSAVAAPLKEVPAVQEMVVDELVPHIEKAISEHLAEQADVPRETLDPLRPLSDLGFDSINLALVASALNTRHGLELSPAVFFEASTIRGLAIHLAKSHGNALGRTLFQPSGRP